jgi:hypothetical protein
MGDVSVADAIIKGIQGFDAETAYAAIRKDAMEAPPSGITGIGRGCLEAYQVNQVVIFTVARIHSFDFMCLYAEIWLHPKKCSSNQWRNLP